MKAASTVLLTLFISCCAPAQAAPSPAADLERMREAYRKLGDFSITSVDVLKEGDETHHIKGTGYLASTGKLAFKAEDRFQEENPWGQVSEEPPVFSGKLYDGNDVFTSVGGRPVRRQRAHTLQRDGEALEYFFSPSIGLSMLWKELRGHRPWASRIAGERDQFTRRDLGSGRVWVEERRRQGVSS
ncbi:hypothetical protein EON80_18055, partial [bacterium]